MQRLQPPQKCHIYHLRQLKQHPYLERFHTQLVPLHVQLLLRALVLQSRRLQAHAPQPSTVSQEANDTSTPSAGRAAKCVATAVRTAAVQLLESHLTSAVSSFILFLMRCAGLSSSPPTSTSPPPPWRRLLDVAASAFWVSRNDHTSACSARNSCSVTQHKTSTRNREKLENKQKKRVKFALCTRAVPAAT